MFSTQTLGGGGNQLSQIKPSQAQFYSTQVEVNELLNQLKLNLTQIELSFDRGEPQGLKRRLGFIATLYATNDCSELDLLIYVCDISHVTLS